MITRILALRPRAFIPATPSPIPPHRQPHHRRTFAAKTAADEQVEELQELYATAKDEFEIAAEETEKKSIYAASDREAARAELTTFKEAYEKAVGSADGEQIKSRIGTRVRELERAVEAMEERAMED